MQFAGEKIAVFGVGKAGKSSVDSLLESGAIVYAWDDRKNVTDAISDHYKGKNVIALNFDDWPWKDLKALVLSPGVAFTYPSAHPVVIRAQKEKCRIICDIHLLFYRSPDAKYIGITGTNGKSTTTALVHHIAKNCGLNALIGGNFGFAASGLPKLGKDGVYILEVSSYQLDLLFQPGNDDIKFHIAALLNITPDHLDRHGSMDQYIASKQKIFQHQKNDDVAIIAVDDDNTSAIYQDLKKSGKSNRIPVSNSHYQKDGMELLGGVIHDHYFKNTEYDLGNLQYLPGDHNAQNVIAAFAIARSLGISAEKIIQAIHGFKGLAHRLEQVGEKRGILFINDSKATNAVSTEQAFKAISEFYWIAGGIAKEGGIQSLEPYFGKINHAFLIGEAAEDFGKTLLGKVPITISMTLEKAFSDAVKQIEIDRLKGKIKDSKPVILLSPACASFDQFKNYEQRGDAFRSLINFMADEKIPKQDNYEDYFNLRKLNTEPYN